MLEQLAQSEIVEDNPAIMSCIQIALSCVPLGFSNKLDIKESDFKVPVNLFSKSNAFSVCLSICEVFNLLPFSGQTKRA